MITQYEANLLLKEKLPQSAMRNYPSRVSLEIYASVIYFTDYTKQALQEHNFPHIKMCFDLAEHLYLNGERIVRLLIEDSIIYSISSVVSNSSSDQFMIKSILPDTLYKTYKKHLFTIGTTRRIA